MGWDETSGQCFHRCISSRYGMGCLQTRADIRVHTHTYTNTHKSPSSNHDGLKPWSPHINEAILIFLHSRCVTMATGAFHLHWVCIFCLIQHQTPSHIHTHTLPIQQKHTHTHKPPSLPVSTPTPLQSVNHAFVSSLLTDWLVLHMPSLKALTFMHGWLLYDDEQWITCSAVHPWQAQRGAGKKWESEHTCCVSEHQPLRLRCSRSVLKILP